MFYGMLSVLKKDDFKHLKTAAFAAANTGLLVKNRLNANMVFNF